MLLLQLLLRRETFRTARDGRALFDIGYEFHRLLVQRRV